MGRLSSPFHVGNLRLPDPKGQGAKMHRAAFMNPWVRYRSRVTFLGPARASWRAEHAGGAALDHGRRAAAATAAIDGDAGTQQAE